MKLLCIEGNIAAGKTSLISLLKEAFLGDERVVFLTEEVDEWMREGLLSSMYSGRLSGAGFQQVVMSSIVAQLVKCQPLAPSLIVQERSLQAGMEVFARANVPDECELQALQYSCGKLLDALQVDADFVYLRLDADELHARCRRRARESEECVSVEYLRRLNVLHDDWLLRKRGGVTVLDARADLHSCGDAVCDIIRSLLLHEERP